MTTTTLKIFISYSHEDSSYLDPHPSLGSVSLYRWLKPLEKSHGIQLFTDSDIKLGEDWDQRIKHELQESSILMALVSQAFLDSDYCQNVEIETALANSSRIVPIMLSACNWQDHAWLAQRNFVPGNGESIEEHHQESGKLKKLYSRIRGEIEALASELRGASSFPASTTVSPTTSTSPPIPFRIDALQQPGNILFGCDSTFSALTEALEDPRIGVLGIIGDGGMGKTAAVRHWLANLNIDRYGLTHVFAWAFYDRQHDQEIANSDTFFSAVFDFLGAHPLSEDTRTAEYKADCLWTQYSATPKILILDGLEGLQSPLPGTYGELTDPAINALLENDTNRSLSHINRLIIVTSRMPLAGMHNDHPGYREIKLSELDQELGASLLDELGVIGERDQLRAASKEALGHPLCLVLLGRLIAHHFHDRGIRNRYEIYSVLNMNFDKGAEKYVIHAQRIMDYYQLVVKEDPEKLLLEMMGLFHRPMKNPEVQYLINNANFAHALNDQHLIDASLQLERYGLLAPEIPARKGKVRETWDCHPLIREHFRNELCKDKDAWINAHGVLFEYFCQAAPQLPTNTKDMFPLYRAIHHGCQALRLRESLAVYRERMLHGVATGFATNYLGLVAEDVSALERFFSVGVNPEKELDHTDCCFLRGRLAFSLTYFGRLDDAIRCREEERTYFDGVGDQLNIASACEHLSALYLMRGRVVDAATIADDALRHAILAQDFGQQAKAHCRRAAVMYVKNDMSGCARAFEEAKQQLRQGPRAEAEVSGDHGISYRFYKAELASTPEDYAELLRDAEHAQDLDGNWLLPKGFDVMFKALSIWKLGRVGDARILFAEARATLKGSSAIAYLGRFFLAEASFELDLRRLDNARRCVDEGFRIADRYDMPLLRIDCHLAAARINIVEHNLDQARAEIACAELDIDSYHYHLRTLEAELLKGELLSAEGKGGEARTHIDVAMRIIAATGRKSYLERCQQGEH